MISTEVEIAAPPAKVREILLDFSNIPRWHSGFVKSITPLAESGDPTSPGNQLHCVMEGFTFDSSITKNDETTFQWQGPPVFGIVSGLHSFHFEPSQASPNATRFRQTEEYSGPGKFLMTGFLLGGGIKKQFDKFNADLKGKAEQA